MFKGDELRFEKSYEGHKTPVTKWLLIQDQIC